MSAKIEDLKDERVPPCLYWSTEDVANWIGEIGFPHYKECFLTNCVNGRKLITVDASALPLLGITDFEHIKVIAKKIREILTLEEPEWNRSISLHPRDQLGMYLEKKSNTGGKTDKLTYDKFLIQFKDSRWQPPLANHCLILPHD